MNEPEFVPIQADLDALKALRVDASKLQHIEDLLDRFNAFETIPGFDKDGYLFQENLTKHANFLKPLWECLSDRHLSLPTVESRTKLGQHYQSHASKIVERMLLNPSGIKEMCRVR